MYSAYWDAASYFLYLAQSLIGMLFLKKACTSNQRIVAGHGSFNLYSLSLLVLWTFFATFRLVNWNVGGTDAMNYIIFFENSWGSFDEMMEHSASDVVFLWINKAIRLIASDYRVCFAILYAFMAYSIIQFVKRFTDRHFNFIPLLLAFYLYLRGYNTLRSNLAIAFILLGLISVADKRYRWAYFYMICAALTHKAGIVFSLCIPYLHYAMVRGIKIKYMIAASIVMFMVASYLRDYFILYASLNDLGGSYGSYVAEAKETGGLLSGVVECFMQYALAVIVLLFSNKIKLNAQKEGKPFADVVNMLLYICYFDIMLIPINAALGIWRGYEFLYIPRLCMWGAVLYAATKKINISDRFILNVLIFVYFVAWFSFRLSRTYEDSNLMPYMFDLF